MPPIPRRLSGFLATVVLVAAVSILLVLLDPHAPALNLSVVYLFLPPRRSLQVTGRSGEGTGIAVELPLRPA
jgi:hypothetical protein